jgi:glucuronate isomerase
MPELLHPDRLFPTDTSVRDITRDLYRSVKSLPIISPHGHTDAAWFASNEPFTNPTELLIKPDHYVYRMLYSHGIGLAELGISASGQELDNSPAPEQVWQLFAQHYHLFQGTPTRIWLDHVFAEVFGLQTNLNDDSADYFYEVIQRELNTPEFLPRALFERFGIELLATTESPLDSLQHHATLQASDWSGRVITTFRPDPVVDPEFEGFRENVEMLGTLTNEDTATYSGYLNALRQRREFFRQHGATATDHGHPTARTADLSRHDAEQLYNKVSNADGSAEEAELFRAQMLTEMAGMSLEDGMVMQLHPGSFRNHNLRLFETYGRDRGADIPTQTDYVSALKPMLDRYGNEKHLSVILFTLDETAYSRELAPLAGHYPCLKLGPSWWFHDSPEGMRRFRKHTTETAGFYNTVGFNDDTRAFLSIPARHDMARRIDCGYLAGLVADHRLPEAEAYDLAKLLAYDLAKRAYKL